MSAERSTTFGELLGRYRRAAGLTQEALAERAGLGVRTIQGLERGESKPLRDTALRLDLEDAHRAPFLAAAGPAPRHPTTGQASRTAGSARSSASSRPASFPEGPLTNLPTPTTSFVGRERELADLTRLLGQTRLLTLTGPGGTGKTRLAVRLAAAVTASFPDGVEFVPLAAVSDPSLLAPTIAAVLGIHHGPGQSLRSALMAFAHPKRMLLLLDNFEQIEPAAPLLSELLTGCPTLTILVTSRASLHLSGEQEYAVPPLAVPASEDPSIGSLEELERWPSVTLFAQRARLVQPDFALSATNGQAIVEICRRVDGLPLAIELAAARVKLLAPDALLARLDQRLALLTGGPRDLPDRQRTLRATIAWSHDLLTEPEWILFRSLAVFSGGWSLGAAEAISGPATGGTLDTLGSLLDKSLVVAETPEEGETRYRMLETIREYGLECLEASGEGETVRRRHAIYYVDLVQESSALPISGPTTMWAWRSWAEREQDNLRAATRWARDQDEVELEMWLIVSFVGLWSLRGDFHKSRDLEERLASLLAMHRDRIPSALRVRALGKLGATKWILGEYSQAGELLEEGLALCQAEHLPDYLGTFLHLLGHVAREQGEYERARARFEELLTLERGNGGQRETVTAFLALLGLADIARERGDAASVVSYCEESLILTRAIGAPAMESFAINNLGLAAWMQGDLRRAGELLADSVRRHQEMGNRSGVAEVLGNVARLARAEGRIDDARAALGESLTLSRASGPFCVLVSDLEELAGLEGGHRAEGAARLFGAARAVRDDRGMPRWPILQATYERDLDATRARLGDAAFAAAWARGQGMTMEDAVTLALELV
jgi:predicted ATPase/DNA-binding XRE family transcriptional regulator